MKEDGGGGVIREPSYIIHVGDRFFFYLFIILHIVKIFVSLNSWLSQRKKKLIIVV